MIITLRHGDSFEVLKEIPDNSLAAVISDPPYLISFMGKSWDAEQDGDAMQEWHRGWTAECFRALKPGGVIKAFSATRTFHRLAAAMVDVGFHVVGLEAWAYGSGFPKSLNVSKELDRVLGAERGKVQIPAAEVRNPKSIMSGHGVEGGDRPWLREAAERGFHEKDDEAPVTEEARQYEGFGTALKPAWEPFVVGKKPDLFCCPQYELDHYELPKGAL